METEARRYPVLQAEATVQRGADGKLRAYVRWDAKGDLPERDTHIEIPAEAEDDPWAFVDARMLQGYATTGPARPEPT